MSIDLGESTDILCLQKLFELEQKKVADIGCGKGEFAAAIAALGAQVSGVEPDPTQAALNRTAAPVEGLELLEGGAESLPFDDHSQDLLVFRFSLHHIPETLYPQVFREAARVLKPGGRLYVIEPVAQGSSQYVMELFHDETEVRARAQQALRELTPAWFEHGSTHHYEVVRRYPDFTAYVKRYGNLSYNHYGLDAVNNSKVHSRFLAHQLENGSVELRQPVRADLYTHR